MAAEKVKRASYTPEYKLEAVRLIQGGQSCAAAAKVLWIPSQTLENWVRQAAQGQLTGAGAKPVSAEQMELTRLRAELARAKMERDILKKATGDSTGHCNTAEIFCDGDKRFNVFLGRSFNSSAIISSCSCE